MSAGACVMTGDVFADFIKDCAQKRGGCRIKQRPPQGKAYRNEIALA
ncbi:hypothetical protein ABIF97_004135 [Bradyrhizobium japonicum]